MSSWCPPIMESSAPTQCRSPSGAEGEVKRLGKGFTSFQRSWDTTNFRELPQVLGSVPDLEPRVQEALQDDHRWEQRLPRRLRPLPAIGADGHGGGFGFDVLRFLLEHAVGGLQVVGPRRLG